MNLTKFVLFALLLFSLTNKATECVNDTSVCSFYCQKSDELNCSASNYLKSFGYKYCRLFINKEQSYTKAGRPIFERIRNCLVNRLASQNNLTCESVAPIAVASHVDCYIDNNFCELNNHDRLTTLWFIRSELLDRKFLPTMAKIVSLCEQRKPHHH